MKVLRRELAEALRSAGVVAGRIHGATDPRPGIPGASIAGVPRT